MRYVRQLLYVPALPLGFLWLLLRFVSYYLVIFVDWFEFQLQWLDEVANGLPHPAMDERRDNRVWQAVASWLAEGRH